MGKIDQKTGIVEAIFVNIITFIGFEFALVELNSLKYLNYWGVVAATILISLVAGVIFYRGMLKHLIPLRKFMPYFYHHFSTYLVIYIGTAILYIFTYKSLLQQTILLSAVIAGTISILFSFHLIKHSPLSSLFELELHKKHITRKKSKLILCLLYSYYKFFGVFIFFTALYSVSLYYSYSFLGLGILAGLMSFVVMHHNFLIHHDWTWRLKIHLLNLAVLLGALSVILYLLNINYIFGGLIFVFLFAVLESVFILMMKKSYSKKIFYHYTILALVLAGILIAAIITNDIFEGHLRMKDGGGSRIEKIFR